MAGIRAGLLVEILVMALDTLRANKLRSALTILGVVIGITSIVSMTALIRGFDESFKDLFRQVGPNTLYIEKFGLVSLSQGKDFRDVIKRPEPDDRGCARDRAVAARRAPWRSSSAAASRPDRSD